MKKIIVSTILIAISACALFAKEPKLQFHDGQFKILQLTDMHLSYNIPEEYAKTISRVEKIIEAEKPDVIMLTGDIVTGQKETRDKMWEVILSALDGFGVPYCLSFGNHDAEGNMTRTQMSEAIVKERLSLNKLNKKGELADMRISVMSSDGKRAALDLIMMDSHDYPQNMGFEKDRYGSYAWFTHEQVDWMREGGKAPALAFFHIPLLEYNDARNNGGVIGIAGERNCPGYINSGMFAAMLEKGNVMGVFVGHDHDNNYIVNHYGIALGYGGFSGDDTTYNHLAHGLRIISVKEEGREFDTWIHDEDGRIQFRANYNNGRLTKMK